MLIRLLLVGGGGCGKSRIINKVLTPLIRAFYGCKGLMKEAQSNKAAKNIGGETIHHANKLLAISSLLTAHLRPKPSQEGLVNRLNRLGAKIFDEFSQIAAKMFHADAYFTTIARASGGDGIIDASKYAEMSHSWGSMPIVVLGGDELQFPPVPIQSGLLAPIEGTSSERKTGVKIFNSFSDVFRLTTAMRFDDRILIESLRKMRQKGGCRLSTLEWKAIEKTNVTTSEHLDGTDLWYESAYEWSIVSMAQVVRSELSAKHHKPLCLSYKHRMPLSILIVELSRRGGKLSRWCCDIPT